MWMWVVWIWTNQRGAKTLETKKHTCLSTGRVSKDSMGFGSSRPGFRSQYPLYVCWKPAALGGRDEPVERKSVRQEWGVASTYEELLPPPSPTASLSPDLGNAPQHWQGHSACLLRSKKLRAVVTSTERDMGIWKGQALVLLNKISCIISRIHYRTKMRGLLFKKIIKNFMMVITEH